MLVNQFHVTLRSSVSVCNDSGTWGVAVRFSSRSIPASKSAKQKGLPASRRESFTVLREDGGGCQMLFLSLKKIIYLLAPEVESQRVLRHAVRTGQHREKGWGGSRVLLNVSTCPFLWAPSQRHAWNIASLLQKCRKTTAGGRGKVWTKKTQPHGLRHVQTRTWQ